MRRYTVLLHPEGEEAGYYALVPALPDCEARGDTPEEAVANARAAIERRVSEIRAAGGHLPVEEDVQWAVTVEIPDEP